MSELILKDELLAAAKKDTLVFIGATAAGKDTIMRSVAVEADVDILVSHSTRPMRDGEMDGVEYYFVDNDEFDEIPMVERRDYLTAGTDVIWKYGLSEEVASRHGLVIMDWNGFHEFRDWRLSVGLDAPIAVFVNVDKETARRRQMKRGDYNVAEFERRWSADLGWVELARRDSRWEW